MNTIKAIETVYQGNRFRSRLAAQWAVFFDAVGIRYKHMTNGYDLGLGIHYLLDFWLPEFEMFVEVMGQNPTSEEQMKAALLAKFSGFEVAMLGAIPRNTEDYSCPGYLGYVFFSNNPEPKIGHFDGHFMFSYAFSKCELCGKVGFNFEGWVQQCDCHAFDRKDIEKGYAAARQARFKQTR